mgnify:CR=1 FL=1
MRMRLLAQAELLDERVVALAINRAEVAEEPVPLTNHQQEAAAEGAVDAALRPEGKAGPLVRTLSSHQGYYEKWAKTWEFQALLKARWPDGRMLFTPLVCFGLMIFYVFAMQCMSTIAIVKRETNGWKWQIGRAHV